MVQDSNRRDAGTAALVTVFCASAMFVASALGLSSLGARMLERTRAQTAADAAALAWLRGGPSAAASVADANGGILVSSTPGPRLGTVTVVVRLGESTASARATDAP